MTDSPTQTVRCDACMKTAHVHDDPESDAAWNDPLGAHACEACASTVCTNCAMAKQFNGADNPGWQCPECGADNLQEL